MRYWLLVLVLSIPFLIWRDGLIVFVAITVAFGGTFSAAFDPHSFLHRSARWMVGTLGWLLTVYFFAMAAVGAIALMVGLGMTVYVAIALVVILTVIAVSTSSNYRRRQQVLSVDPPSASS